MRFAFATSVRPLRYFALLLVVPALMLCIGCGDDGPTGPQSASFDWSGTVESGDRLEIRGVNGSIVASSVAGRTATVTAQLRGNGDDASTAPGEWSGTIGGGGPLITLTAVNGNLSLVRTR